MIRPRPERGAVTAELALTIPLLVAVAIGLTWLLSLGTAQVRLVDATREAARALARGDPRDQALDRARVVGPEGTVLAVTATADEVIVAGSVEVDGIGGLFDLLPAVELTSRSVAAAERTSP